jgi:Zn-finger nucleic acid-binding protein
MPTHLPSNEGVELEKQIRYLPCPVCKNLMNRVNFANFSNVIVDVCREHGTWFDRDELRRIVEFIRDGGLDKARARAKMDFEEEQRLARADKFLSGVGEAPSRDSDIRHNALSMAAQVLFDLLR